MTVNDIDIHQLDTERQVLFILNENDTALSAREIKDKLIAHGISPKTKPMKSFLESTLRDKRREFIRDGLVHKDGPGYRIMQKGREYLQSTVIVIDPSGEKSIQETIGEILSSLSGAIKLCDPYFDDKAYQLLSRHLDSEKIKSIKVIHSKDGMDATKNYKIGNHSMEFKKKKNDIHDRFLIDDSHLYVLGTSLNHIGDKLSFIFNLSIYKEKFDSIFQDHWNSA